jgi:spore maturation protein CgeB
LKGEQLLKIACFSASPIMKYGLMPGFEKNGEETKIFPMACMGDEMVTLELDGQVIRVPYTEQDKINSYIGKCVAQYGPDYVILEGYQGELALGISMACEKYGCGFIYWSIEDPVGFARTLPIAKMADIVFTTALECIREYRNQGIQAHLLMFGCNPEFHQSGVYRPQYDLDFAVQASWYNFASRIEGFNILLKPLLGLGHKYRIWGYNWDSDPQARAFLGDNGDHFAGILPNEKLPDLCASARIILGFQCDSSSITQTSMRNYEVLSCGGFYLCQYTKASAYIFREGAHLELARDKEEAVSKVLFYLAHDQERIRVARLGQEYVHRRHSYEVRVSEDVLPHIERRA